MRRILTGRGLAALLGGMLLLAGSYGWWLVYDASARGVGLGTGIFSTGSCGSSGAMTRQAPSFCIRVAQGSQGQYEGIQTSSGSTCTAVDFTADDIPPYAQAVVVQVYWQLYRSATTTGYQSGQIGLYTDATCTTPNRVVSDGGYSYAPTESAVMYATDGGGSLADVRSKIVTFYTRGNNTALYIGRTATVIAGGTVTTGLVGPNAFYD